jgi:hypothetical protein
MKRCRGQDETDATARVTAPRRASTFIRRWLDDNLSTIIAAIIATASIALASPAVVADEGREIWLSPTDDVTQHGRDFHDYFLHPEEWRRTAGIVTRFSIPIRYLLTTPPQIVTKELAVLHDLGVHLDVAILAMPVDKNKCGNHIEGTVWPKEPASYSKKLKALGADVYSFSLDLPLNAGYIDKGLDACNLSVREAAEHTAHAVADVLAVYPTAQIVDIEVPTGMPAAKWGALLAEWADEYKRASGRNFDGFMMDAWWEFDWRSAARETVRVLGPRRIPVGIGIDASGHNHVPAVEWIAAAKQNTCDLRAAHISLNYYGVANFQNMDVPGLPESDPNTLTGLALWVASNRGC